MNRENQSNHFYLQTRFEFTAKQTRNISPCQATARLRWTEAIRGPVFLKYVSHNVFSFSKDYIDVELLVANTINLECSLPR